MSTAWLATFRRDRRGLSSAAAFSKRGLKFSSLMRVGGTLWDGQAHCTQSTLQHGQAAFAAAARVQAQPMPARSATGCEPAVHNQQARHMRLFCSSSSSKGGKSSRSSPQPPSQADLITIKGVGPVNKALLISKGVDSVNRLHELYHTEANAKDEEMVKFLRVRSLSIRMLQIRCHALFCRRVSAFLQARRGLALALALWNAFCFTLI